MTCESWQYRWDQNGRSDGYTLSNGEQDEIRNTYGEIERTRRGSILFQLVKNKQKKMIRAFTK